MDKDPRLLIIPDVHGRTFWKKAVQTQDYDTVIFLGDYVDPYEEEGISDDQAYQNFAEILQFKKRQPRQVVLLLGNHDLHYASDRFCLNACGSRYNEDFAYILQQLFVAHRSDFKLAYQVDTDRQRYLFTHAGVNTSWYRRHEQQIKELQAPNLNRLLTTNRGIDALSEIAPARGGYYPTGSIVWADKKDMMSDQPFPDLYQVFGHTLSSDGPLITQHFACLDCRTAFLLQSGEFHPVQ